MRYVVPAFVVLVFAEIWVLVTIGGLIGAGPTILLLALGSLIGVWLLRREGSRAFGALRKAVHTRRTPHRELADGALVFLGGLLMLLPGFISDVLGLLCLLPPTRALVRKAFYRIAAGRLPGPLLVRTRRYPPTRAGEPTVIEGELER